MRADRLVAILLLLQRRGQVTAAEVAAELEVSERTARRDLDALGVAGLPVYSQQGRGGGYRLAGGGKIDLSGLSAAEARALFLVAGPSSGATPELRAALRKLVRALPEQFRASADAATTSVVVDRAGWDGGPSRGRRPDLLDEVQRAVVEGLQVRLGYTNRARERSERVVEPLGLAAKGDTWYLVADTEAGLRTFRVDRMASIEPTGLPVTRPAGFDLSGAWALISDEVERLRTPVSAHVLVDAAMLGLVQYLFGTRLGIGAPVADGRVEAEIRGQSERSLAGEIAGLGAMIEVLEPAGVRERLAAVGAELVATYADAAPASSTRSNQASRPKRPSS
jgi:predicted DNA-binding transcriptional regulator YafY